MVKVKVTKKVAEIIEALRGVVSDTTLIKIVSAECGGDNPGLAAAIAIHQGYEIGETPEDLVKAYYDELECIVPSRMNTTEAMRQAVSETLAILGYRIEGIPPSKRILNSENFRKAYGIEGVIA